MLSFFDAPVLVPLFKILMASYGALEAHGWASFKNPDFELKTEFLFLISDLIAGIFPWYACGMKNFKTVSDEELITQIRIDAGSERHAGLAVIHQLREISRRRLYAKLRYSSLHKYCMEDLKYSSGSAARRIASMEALEELPELEAKIEQGELTLASLSQIQSFCARNEMSLDEKKEILEQCSGLSKRETEKKLAEIAPQPERPDKTREIDGEKTELRMTFDQETIAALDKIRNLISHSCPNATYVDAVRYLARLGLKKLDPAREPSGKPSRKSKAASEVENAGETKDAANQAKSFPPGDRAGAQKDTSGVSFHSGNGISAANRRAVWQRDRGQCTYVDPQTGRGCGSTRLIQVDHIIPRAVGGGHELSNLRLRCRTHNLLAAIQVFGAEKMNSYFGKT